MAGLLGLAVQAASAHGSALRPGAPELADLPGVVFLASTGTAFALYLVALLVVRQRRPSLFVVCAVAVAVQIVPLAGPLLLSRDVYAYWTYGRMVAVHGANPYAAPPARFGSDPGEQAMAPAWRGTESVYGPVFSAASTSLAQTTGRSPERAAFTYRLLASLGMLAIVWLTALLAPVPAFAAVFVGWNPLLALSSAGGGHNDVWMIALLLGALVLSARRRPALAGAGWALAVGVKWVPLAFLSLSVAAARGRDARRIAFGFLATATAIAGAAWLVFGTAWLTVLLPLGRRNAGYALPSRVVELGAPRAAVEVVAAAASVAAFVCLLRSARAGRPRLGLAAGVLLIATPWILPWYAIWIVPLAAVDEDRVAWALALGFTAYLLPDRIPL